MSALGREQPPDMATLEARLKTRAQDSAAVVAGRMAKSAEEMSHWSEYAYVVVNRDLAQSVRGRSDRHRRAPAPHPPSGARRIRQPPPRRLTTEHRRSLD